MPTGKIQKVVVAGVTGTVGPPVIKHLLASGFTVTALTTKPDRAKERYGDTVTTIEADYSSVSTLASALRHHDALVILLNRVELSAQIQLIDAAVEAGIAHLIPSCFGLDTRKPENQDNPLIQEKIEMEKYLVEKVAREQGGRLAFTGIQTGIFLDWSLRIGVVLNCTAEGQTILFDGGHTRFSATALEDIGRAVANALLKAEQDEMRNQFLLVHSAALTQSQLLKYGKEARPEWAWKTFDVDTEAAWKKSKEAYDRGERDRQAMMGLFARATFGRGFGLFEPNDNELLGIEEWSEERLAGLVKDIIDEKAK